MSDPWFEAFRRDPDRAVADLFSGRAGAGSDLRLDVPELLYQQFPPSLADERAQLDDALGSWLSDMREGYASRVQRLGFSVYGKRVGDALVALQLLDLPRTRGRIRTDTGACLAGGLGGRAGRSDPYGHGRLAALAVAIEAGP